MPSSRNQKTNNQLSPREYQRRDNAARAAAQRLYCDVFGFWRACTGKPCRRARLCRGDPAACLRRGIKSVPKDRYDGAQAAVMAGGPRRIPAATPHERALRGYPLSSLW